MQLVDFQALTTNDDAKGPAGFLTTLPSHSPSSKSQGDLEEEERRGWGMPLLVVGTA